MSDNLAFDEGYAEGYQTCLAELAEQLRNEGLSAMLEYASHNAASLEVANIFKPNHYDADYSFKHG
jgi:hypothetical protein